MHPSDHDPRPAAANPSIGFTVAGQFGDPSSSDTIWPHAILLKRAFFADGAAPLSGGLKEIAFLLRGDGKFQTFNFEGHENIIVNKKERWASVDIGVPFSRWQNTTPASLAEYLSESFLNSLPDVLAACAKKELRAEPHRVARRLERALAAYRASVARGRHEPA